MDNEQQLAEIFFTAREQRRKELAENIYPASEQNILKPTWELMHSDDLTVIIPRAIELGWSENKVQVKRYTFGPERYHYYIEPYEDCACPNLLKYEDYVPIKTEIEG